MKFNIGNEFKRDIKKILKVIQTLIFKMVLVDMSSYVLYGGTVIMIEFYYYVVCIKNID